jgi:hypothetical protein
MAQPFPLAVVADETSKRDDVFLRAVDFKVQCSRFKVWNSNLEL